MKRTMIFIATGLLLSSTPVHAQEPGRAPEGPTVHLEQVASGITAPVFSAAPRDGTGRLFIVDQVGLIRVVENDRLRAQPFLDVRNKLVDLNERYDERGLLGLAFHPNYRNNGRFYVYMSVPLRSAAPDGWNHTARVSEFRASSNDPNRSDPGTERVVMEIDQPQGNHNGGHITFGPDGMLYIPLGDGGGGSDAGVGHPRQGNAQDTSNILGSILRIDVNEQPFGVPDDNPFVADNDGIRDEIWAYGLRNPYHISFDAQTGDLYAADAGQARIEEVSRIAKGGNHGWRIKEGTHCFDPGDPSSPPPSCPSRGARDEPLIDPVIEYSREQISGTAVIGGYVYRGDAVPYLKGRYVFGDYNRSRIEPDGALFVATPAEGAGVWPIRELRVVMGGASDAPAGSPTAQATQTTHAEGGDLDRFVLSFGEDERRELYVGVIERGGPTGMTGAVYRLAATPGQGAPAEPRAPREQGGSVWPWIAAAAAIAALVIFGLARVARNRS